VTVPGDMVQTILSFLAQAEAKGVHLAMHGRPPYGKEGTWFLDKGQYKAFVVDCLMEMEECHGVQPSGVQGVREDPAASVDPAG